MQHSNASLHSLNENLYDISISGLQKLQKKRFHPRRVGLASSLATQNDVKRPGEYYLQKLSQSALHLPKAPSKRPNSNVSMSSEVSKDSDDDSSVGSSPFDMPDSRLSSMTAHSLYSKAGEAEGNKLAHSAIAERTFAEEDDQMSASISTITLKDNESASSLSEVPSRSLPLPKLRAASTSNMLGRHVSETDKMPGLSRQNTVGTFTLSRTKTRFFNAKESRERKQLRKKMYEDNDDDVILSNDMDLVFNVPVIQNSGEFYRYKDSSAALLSRNDIVKADDNTHPFKPAVPVKPCPLPGKLSQSSLSVDTTSSSAEHSVEDAIDDHERSFSYSYDDDEISRNISEFYSQRSVSYSKLVKKSREQHMVYKLPNYIRSQNSIEDISLFSPEKLKAVDQSRPINLPPKCITDKAKHSKEFHRVLTNFELNTKSQNDTRKKLGELFIVNLQAWFKLMITVNEEKDFSKKLYNEKEKFRNLSWDSLIAEKFRFDYFFTVLSLNLGKGFAEQARQSFAKLEEKYVILSDQMRATKDADFDRVIDRVLDRPIYRSILTEIQASDDEFSMDDLKSNFRHLLYLKSLSQDGLKKHHEIFVIPMFLILFQKFESFSRICILIEMFDNSIFELDMFGDLNKKLSQWKSLSQMSSSSEPYKILSKFNSLQEFEFLNSMSIFELIIQLNDRLPLSLSAPSTPIVAQSSFTGMSRSGDSRSASAGSTATNSLDSLPELNLSNLYAKSSALSLVGIVLQLLVTYSNSPKSKRQNHMKLFQSFLLTVFTYYHINWNSCTELVKENKSIRLNNTNDQLTNLKSFTEKWREIFKRI